jgi:uncharacterized SAM-binding protein YcdF (DUF218 family)
LPNDWLLSLDLGAWKPVLTVLLLPPASILWPMLLGAWLLRRRPAAMWACLLAGSAALWFSTTLVAGRALQQALLQPPPALAAADREALRRTGAGTAIVVLGGGREPFAAEYEGPNLGLETAARLRYGLWLARETGLPVAFSGGVGHAAVDGPAEAEIAARVAARDFGRPLRWVEADSRDTRENAERSVALLRGAGVHRIVLVTHGWHMPRSLRAFEQAARRQGTGLAIVAAPMGLGEGDLRGVLRWLPSVAGHRLTSVVLREWLGRLAGA